MNAPFVAWNLNTRHFQTFRNIVFSTLSTFETSSPPPFMPLQLTLCLLCPGPTIAEDIMAKLQALTGRNNRLLPAPIHQGPNNPLPTSLLIDLNNTELPRSLPVDLPSDLPQLPLQTMEDLEIFERHISDDSNFKQVVRYF